MAVWTPTLVSVTRDPGGRQIAEVKYVNQTTQETQKDSISLGGLSENDWRARIRSKVDELQNADTVSVRLTRGVIDTTPIPPTKTQAQLDRDAYDAAYRANAKAQQAVRDNVLLANNVAVTTRLAAVIALFKPEYLDT